MSVAAWEGLAAVTAVCAFLAVVGRHLLAVGRQWSDFLDDLRGEPARPGVPERPGVMRRLELNDERWSHAGPLLEHIVAEMPKNGRPMRAVIDEIAATQTEHGAAIAELRAEHDAHLTAVHGLPRPRRAS